jgi:hypothetical protein
MGLKYMRCLTYCKSGTHALLGALYVAHFIYCWTIIIIHFWIRKQHDVTCIESWGKGIFHIIGHGICM